MLALIQKEIKILNRLGCLPPLSYVDLILASELIDDHSRILMQNTFLHSENKRLHHKKNPPNDCWKDVLFWNGCIRHAECRVHLLSSKADIRKLSRRPDYYWNLLVIKVSWRGLQPLSNWPGCTRRMHLVFLLLVTINSTSIWEHEENSKCLRYFNYCGHRRFPRVLGHYPSAILSPSLPLRFFMHLCIWNITRSFISSHRMSISRSWSDEIASHLLRQVLSSLLRNWIFSLHGSPHILLMFFFISSLVPGLVFNSPKAIASHSPWLLNIFIFFTSSSILWNANSVFGT